MKSILACFRSVWIISAQREVVGALARLEDVDELADEVPEAVHCPLADLPEHGLELGEGLLDRIEVGAVGREEAQRSASRFDPFTHRDALVARQVVHDYDVARPQFGHEHLSDVGFEPVAVDRAVQDHRCDHSSHAQPGDQRGRLAVAVRKAHPQALAPGAAAMAAGHVGRGPGFVDKHEPLGVEVELAIEPVMPLAQDVGPVLFDRMPSLYGMARPFSPASDMMRASEKGKERTDVYCDPWR